MVETVNMKTLTAFALLLFGGSFVGSARAQEATQTTVELPLPVEIEPTEPSTRAALPSPSPDIPELSRLDEAFKRTSIGKAADEFRRRVEIRQIQNRVSNDDDVIAAKKFSEAARTDLEKRERLRNYYDLYYGRMRRLAPDQETRQALDDQKASHVKLLEQPRVRPIPGQPLPPVPKKDKSEKPKKSRFGRTSHH